MSQIISDHPWRVHWCFRVHYSFRGSSRQTTFSLSAHVKRLRFCTRDLYTFIKCVLNFELSGSNCTKVMILTIWHLKNLFYEKDGPFSQCAVLWEWWSSLEAAHVPHGTFLQFGMFPIGYHVKWPCTFPLGSSWSLLEPNFMKNHEKKVRNTPLRKLNS